MAETKSTQSPPKVYIVRPKGRCLQLMYQDPETGKQVRTSTGTRDEKQAEFERGQLEARLRLGVKHRTTKMDLAEAITWQDFRFEYSQQKVAYMRPGPAADAESRLDVTERILKPRLLVDVATEDAMDCLQRQLLRGAESRFSRPRASATVKGYMKSVMASLSFAKKRRWIERVPEVDLIVVEQSDEMKGRPLSGSEIDLMLEAVTSVVGEGRAKSWQYVIHGVIASGLRMGELMAVSWDVPHTIQPTWEPGREPVMWFPSHQQKSKRQQTIPMCPWLESLLLETPPELRTGWAFNPESIQGLHGRRGPERLSAERVGKLISRIGERAGIVVDPGNPRTGSPKKYASLHDLRRTFAQRLADSHLPPELVRQLMRHADIRTTERFYQVANVQRDASRIRDCLAPESSEQCSPRESS